MKLELGWLPKEEYAFIYSGYNLGFFKNHGIDLKLQNNQGSATAEKVLASGAGQFAYTGGPTFFQSVDAGIPFVMVADFLQASPEVILSWPGSSVHSIADLCGKKVILTPGDGFTGLWPSVAKLNGIDPSCVQALAIGVSARAQSLIAHQADALPWYVTTSVLTLEKQAHTKFNVLHDFKGNNLLNNGLFTTQAMIQKHPDIVKRMTEAMVQSWNWTATHQKSAARIILSYLPGYDLGDVISTVRATMKLGHTNNSKGLPTGCMTLADWKESWSIMAQGGLVKKVPNPAIAYTNNFVPGCLTALKKHHVK